MPDDPKNLGDQPPAGATATAEPRVWHGTHSVPEERMITVAVGPLELSIAHRPGEWRIGWHRGGLPGDDPADGDPAGGAEPAAAVSEPAPIADPDAELTVQRFLTQQAGDAIRLRPLLADRPVVARPELPIAVPAGDQATIFVSTPVWVRAELPEPDRQLLEIPVTRPSDTWFGATTRRGTVAYASHTAARLQIDNLPRPSHRAITRVTVRNQTAGVLALERLSVPAPNLTLFADAGGGLWTTPLTATRDSETQPARVELGDEAPVEAAGATQIAEPREATERNVFSRALHVLVG